MKPENIDFHYHAGLERLEGTSLEDYLLYARKTGRRMLGVTDHWDLYELNRHKTEAKPRTPLYDSGVKGLAQFQADLSELRPKFPDLKIFFTPEISHQFPEISLKTIPKGVLDLSDFVLFELPFAEQSREVNTKVMINRIKEISQFLNTHGKKGFLAHPIRYPILYQLKNLLSSNATNADLSVEKIKQDFAIDINQVGKAIVEYGLPMEINASTVRHILRYDVGGPMMLSALQEYYNSLKELGVDFVFGSDLHAIDTGIEDNAYPGYFANGFVEKLNLSLEQLSFIQELK